MIYFCQQRKWLPVLHELTEVRGSILPVTQRNGSWFYRPRKLSSQNDNAKDTSDRSASGETDTNEATTNDSIEIANIQSKSDDEVNERDSEEQYIDDDDVETLNELQDSEVELKINDPDLDLISLFCDFMKFYSQEFDIENMVISLRYSKPVTRKMKHWGARRVAIEDPFMRKRNICRSLSSQLTFEYFRTRLQVTYLRIFIGSDQYKDMIAHNQLATLTGKHHLMPESNVNTEIDELTNAMSSQKIAPRVNKRNKLFSSITEILESRKPSKEDIEKIEKDYGVSVDFSNVDEVEEVSLESLDVDAVANEAITQELAGPFFNRDKMSGGLRPVRICQMCKKECSGKVCPDDVSKKLMPPLPELSKHQENI